MSSRRCAVDDPFWLVIFKLWSHGVVVTQCGERDGWCGVLRQGFGLHKGGAHCGHIPVSVSRAEAVHSAAVSGKRMAKAPAHAVHVSQDLEQIQGDGYLEDTGPGRWEHYIGKAAPA